MVSHANIRNLVVIFVGSLLSFVTCPAFAQSSYENGVKFYQTKNYKAAARDFEQAMIATPGNPDIIYYCALSHQLSGNRARSRQLFEYILTNFPTSRVAGSARVAVEQLSRTASSGNTGSSSQQFQGASGSQSPNSVPDEVRVPFEKRGNDVIVQVQVNGRPVNFVLDTGASSVVVGQNHLQEWGVQRSEGREKFETQGVGETKTRAWQQKLDLKLGQIYVRDFPVTVQESLPTEPLLGQTFLRAFNVSIQDSSRTVILARKDSQAAKRIGQKRAGGKEIPFRRGSGGHMLVDVKVNNKPYTMIFDTGAESTTFSLSDWKKLGLEVPEGARKGIARGVQGDATFSFCTCDLALGPISKQDFEVHVLDTSRSIPLLGMSFYGAYKYDIDSSRNVIIFTEEQ